MRKIFKTKYLIPILVTLFFIGITVSGAHATESISGDTLCGSSSSAACNVSNLKALTGGVLKAIIVLLLPLLVIFIAYHIVMAWYSLQQGNANAYRDAFRKILQSLLGFIVVVALLGGVFLTMLKFVGVQAFPLKFLQILFSAIVPHAYAQDAILPNPTGATDLYDFILSVVRLVMRFFIYPAFIVMWVWTGIQFVMAEGNPEALGKAKKWLLWAFVSTVVVMMLQAFLVAVRVSVDRVFSSTSSQGIERHV